MGVSPGPAKMNKSLLLLGICLLSGIATAGFWGDVDSDQDGLTDAVDDDDDNDGILDTQDDDDDGDGIPDDEEDYDGEVFPMKMILMMMETACSMETRMMTVTVWKMMRT